MSVFVKPLMDWFMFGMVIETGPKFYIVPFPTQKVTDSKFVYKSFVINVVHFHFFFAKPLMDIIQLWRDDRALSKMFCSTIPIPLHDLKIKVTDLEFFCIKSSQCQLSQNLWLIWIVFGIRFWNALERKSASRWASCPVRRQVLLRLTWATCLYLSGNNQ